MKRLTLNETWKLCLAMWKWIAEQVKKGRGDIANLKWEWLEEHGFGDKYISCNCFFCTYDTQHCADEDDGCVKCPGKKVDKSFDCTNTNYHFRLEPIAFYNKLVSLNRKRKKLNVRR